MSIAYFNPNMPDGYIQERVYPMEIGDPEELLKEIVGLELQGNMKWDILTIRQLESHQVV